MELTGSTTRSTLDIKNMANLLIDKTGIGTSIQTPIDDKFIFNKFNLVNPPIKSKRILNTCTVRYLCQSYFYDENSKTFEICDKNYKNVVKDKICNMAQDKAWIRYCLLLMSEGEQSLFEIDKKYLGDFYKKRVNQFFERKKKR